MSKGCLSPSPNSDFSRLPQRSNPFAGWPSDHRSRSSGYSMFALYRAAIQRKSSSKESIDIETAGQFLWRLASRTEHLPNGGNCLGKMIDTAFVICFLIAFLVLSVLGIVRAFRKKPKSQGKPAVLPVSWSRWILEEKKPRHQQCELDQTDRLGWFGTVPNFRTRGDGSAWYVLCSPAAFRGPCEGDCERILPGHLPREAAEHL
jgi:hypothetical protein